MGADISMRQNISRLPEWRSGLCSFVKTSLLKICCTPPGHKHHSLEKAGKSVFNFISVVFRCYATRCAWPCQGFVDEHFRIDILGRTFQDGHFLTWFPSTGSQQGSRLVGAWDPHLRDVSRWTFPTKLGPFGFLWVPQKTNRHVQVTPRSTTTTRLGSTRRSSPGSLSGRAMSRWQPRILSSDCWFRWPTTKRQKGQTDKNNKKIKRTKSQTTKIIRRQKRPIVKPL